MRTDYCGRLGLADAGRTVTVCGWVATRREHGEHLAFVDVRDRTGVVQCVVDGAADLRNEYVVAVTGAVRERPAGTTNPDLTTGDIEIGAEHVEVLSAAEPPPFTVRSGVDVDEATRIRHRYVDLRTDRMQRNLRARALVNSAIRAAMEANEFVEIETPLLVASTPEGARDFVVPSRLHHGSFYALPQSPQLFKQLCMVGGMDRYYQIARCLRDEDLRADRQFEFTQLDMEASFVDETQVRSFVDDAVAGATEAVTGSRPGPIAHMTWFEAMDRFGTDKPDTRFDMRLVELTPVFAATQFRAFQAQCVKGMLLPGQAGLGRGRLDALTERAKALGAKGLVWLKVRDDGEIDSPVAKFLSEDEQRAALAALGAMPGDLCLLVADVWRTAVEVLGQLRLDLGRPPVNEGELTFVWVTEFPLFERLATDGTPVPAHHPFTMPHADDVELLGTAEGEDLLQLRSQAYDLVLNGWELGSGSVRIHRPDVQTLVFARLGIGAEEAQQKFGFLLDGFRYGAPPHAGFAFGIDRLAALLVGEENIREVVAFPKTQSGLDPLTNAPTPLEAAHLAELGLTVVPEPAD
jgi:aspartyl-tRNA synthetase